MAAVGAAGGPVPVPEPALTLAPTPDAPTKRAYRLPRPSLIYRKWVSKKSSTSGSTCA